MLQRAGRALQVQSISVDDNHQWGAGCVVVLGHVLQGHADPPEDTSLVLYGCAKAAYSLT